MKTQNLIFLFFLCLCTSCIQDEPLSPYADIEAFALPSEIALTDATINQTDISIYVRKNLDLTSIVPNIKISDGATIEPAIGTPRDFSGAVKYVVKAADGNHQREYTIRTIKSVQYEYKFESWSLMGARFETPIEYDDEGNTSTPWDSSNKGINIYQQFPSPEGYPVHKTTDASEGTYAAEIITQKGPGNILGIINVPIAAGSLFTGVFNPLNALINPLLATQFGQPFYDKPTRLTGSYKYKAGTGDYIAPDGNPIPGVKDSCSIFAVLFKSDQTLNRLDGTNVLKHPNIVALAMLPPEARAGSKGEDFVPFNIDFDYVEGHVIDFEKNDYKLSIVLSSSYYGDRYEGTVGSHLIVDDLKLICEEE